MNILGVGGWELLAILVIMLLFAGPKRMLHWAYILGQYIAKFRVMWAETVDVIQREFDDAGVGIQIPKDPPTRSSMNQQAGKLLENVTRPVRETMDQATSEVNQIRNATASTTQAASSMVNGNGRKQKPKPARPSASTTAIQPGEGSDSFGTWSTKRDNFGSWSESDEKRED